MSQKASMGDRFRYRFDNFMSRGTVALVVSLLAATFMLILTASLVVMLLGIRNNSGTGGSSFIDYFWQLTLHTIDTGALGGDNGWSYRIVGFLVTMGGIFITSALIGVLASGLEQRFSELRRGRSRVLESGHTVILGWSPQVFTIISELALANRNVSNKNPTGSGDDAPKRSACIAILAERDKLEMEEEIKTKVTDTLKTRIVCRSGNPLDRDDLNIVNPAEARAIIILSPGGQYPDLPVAKTLLAITGEKEMRLRPYHIVAAIQRPVNINIMRTIGGDEAQVFMVDRLISFIIAQSCRQSGLSIVYSELFSFEGVAIYFRKLPSLASTTYGEALFRFDNSALIGLRSEDGKLMLNPPVETIIQPGDQVIAIAGADDQFRLSQMTNTPVEASSIPDHSSFVTHFDRLLMLGWNRRAPMILELLSHNASAESQVTVCAPYPVEQMRTECSGVNFAPMQVVFEQGVTIERSNIERLLETNYSIVIILTPTDVQDLQLADATTMVSLIHLRDILKKTGRKLSVVSEIMDVRNRELVQVSSAEEVIISDQLIALAITQIAENKNIAPVFIELLTADQVEIYIKPITDYIQVGKPVNFYTVLAAAQRKGETAIGYRLLTEADNPENKFGVHINPVKSITVPFSEHDQVVVIARTERETPRK